MVNNVDITDSEPWDVDQGVGQRDDPTASVDQFYSRPNEPNLVEQLAGVNRVPTREKNEYELGMLPELNRKRR